MHRSVSSPAWFSEVSGADGELYFAGGCDLKDTTRSRIGRCVRLLEPPCSCAGRTMVYLTPPLLERMSISAQLPTFQTDIAIIHTQPVSP